MDCRIEYLAPDICLVLSPLAAASNMSGSIHQLMSETRFAGKHGSAISDDAQVSSDIAMQQQPSLPSSN
ncbi:hypothetical protein DAPPUDRAFT_232879 [Daphnia pulex]|uniref:Uncharacterized protein n=1 Tax=Daphnia pulex TaxID=6669 RepID=E9FSL1_DAPPU|nr:hypothetical protein DAPPUDRAFT_232879 [Daphnia pulex]|eukprot:EFX89809.1 hypothetical protein DAPPUDRAFT_232879 [Daphnia pulex]